MSETQVLGHPRLGNRPRSAGDQTVPREHGFWVMISVILVTALLRAGFSALALALTLVIATGAVFVAARVGRLLRKRPALQALASVVLAAVGWPVLVLGGEPTDEASVFSGAFAVIFLAGALAVQGILDRARRRPERAAIATVSSIALPAFASVGFLAISVPVAAGVGVTALYAFVLFAWQPTAKKLKTVGWTLALAHLVSGALLALG